MAMNALMTGKTNNIDISVSLQISQTLRVFGRIEHAMAKGAIKTRKIRIAFRSVSKIKPMATAIKAVSAKLKIASIPSAKMATLPISAAASWEDKSTVIPPAPMVLNGAYISDRIPVPVWLVRSIRNCSSGQDNVINIVAIMRRGNTLRMVYASKSSMPAACEIIIMRPAITMNAKAMFLKLAHAA